jgi:phage baseplate assembly protein gpV
MSIPALNSGLQGIQQGFDNLRRNASKVAQAVNPEAAPGVKVAESLVNIKADTLQVQASTKVVETVHDLLGQLLDERA